jgi:hypothetical protein
LPSDWNDKLKKEEFVDFSRIMAAVNPAVGGIVTCHARAWFDSAMAELPEEPQ